MIGLILGWVGSHWKTVAMALLLSWLTIGGSYLFFFRPTTSVKVASGGKYIQAGDGFQPTVGCAIGSQYIGWAHKKAK